MSNEHTFYVIIIKSAIKYFELLRGNILTHLIEFVETYINTSSISREIYTDKLTLFTYETQRGYNML